MFGNLSSPPLRLLNITNMTPPSTTLQNVVIDLTTPNTSPWTTNPTMESLVQPKPTPSHVNPIPPPIVIKTDPPIDLTSEIVSPSKFSSKSYNPSQASNVLNEIRNLFFINGVSVMKLGDIWKVLSNQSRRFIETNFTSLKNFVKMNSQYFALKSGDTGTECHILQLTIPKSTTSKQKIFSTFPTEVKTPPDEPIVVQVVENPVALTVPTTLGSSFPVPTKIVPFQPFKPQNNIDFKRISFEKQPPMLERIFSKTEIQKFEKILNKKLVDQELSEKDCKYLLDNIEMHYEVDLLRLYVSKFPNYKRIYDDPRWTVLTSKTLANVEKMVKGQPGQAISLEECKLLLKTLKNQGIQRWLKTYMEQNYPGGKKRMNRDKYVLNPPKKTKLDIKSDLVTPAVITVIPPRVVYNSNTSRLISSLVFQYLELTKILKDRDDSLSDQIANLHKILTNDDIELVVPEIISSMKRILNLCIEIVSKQTRYSPLDFDITPRTFVTVHCKSLQMNLRNAVKSGEDEIFVNNCGLLKVIQFVLKNYYK